MRRTKKFLQTEQVEKAYGDFSGIVAVVPAGQFGSLTVLRFEK